MRLVIAHCRFVRLNRDVRSRALDIALDEFKRLSHTCAFMEMTLYVCMMFAYFIAGAT